MIDLLSKLFASLDLKSLIGTGVVTALGWLGTVIVKAIRRRNVADAVFHAFHISETLAEDVTDGGKVDQALDTVAAALNEADKWMLAHGWRALKPYEKDRAELMLKSLNGQATMKERLAYASAVVIKGSPVTTLPGSPN